MFFFIFQLETKLRRITWPGIIILVFRLTQGRLEIVLRVNTIQGYHYRASTRLKYQRFDNPLKDEPQVRTLIRQNLLKTTESKKSAKRQIKVLGFGWASTWKLVKIHNNWPLALIGSQFLVLPCSSLLRCGENLFKCERSYIYFQFLFIFVFAILSAKICFCVRKTLRFAIWTRVFCKLMSTGFTSNIFY